MDDDVISLEITDPNDPTTSLCTLAHRHFFEGREKDLPYWARADADQFEYGYALTVHKAQGSQWGNVFLVDESRSFREHAKRWLYTGITRAADSVTVVR